MAARFNITYTTTEKTANATSISDLQTNNASKLGHLSTIERRKIYKMGPRGEGTVNLIMGGVIANPSVAPGTFSLATFNADKDNRDYAILMSNKLGALKEGFDNTIMLLGSNMAKDANLCADTIIKQAETDQNLEELANEIKAARAKNPIGHPHIVIPMGGSVTQEGVKKGARLVNWGSTVLSVYKDGFATGAVVIGPHDSALIPDGWKIINVKNGSTTTDGEFTI